MTDKLTAEDVAHLETLQGRWEATAEEKYSYVDCVARRKEYEEAILAAGPFLIAAARVSIESRGERLPGHSPLEVWVVTVGGLIRDCYETREEAERSARLATDTTQTTALYTRYVVPSSPALAAEARASARLDGETHCLPEESMGRRRPRLRASRGHVVPSAPLSSEGDPVSKEATVERRHTDTALAVLKRQFVERKLTTERARAEEAERLAKHHRLVSEARLRRIAEYRKATLTPSKVEP